MKFKYFQLLKVTLAMGMLLGCSIFFLGMNLIAGPGKVCWTNNDFGEYLFEVILMVNAILWGVGFLVWHVRLCLKSQRPKEENPEEEKWGV